MTSVERTVIFESNFSTSENDGASQNRSIFRIISTYINILNLIFVSVVGIYMTFVCYHYGNAPVSWHVWLCTIGYQVLMTQAILSFYPFNVLTQPYKRVTRKSIHAYVAALATICALSGIIIEYVFRSQKSKPHFSSTHSTIGLIAAIFTFIGGLNGTAAYYSVQLRSFVTPIYVKCLHNLNGTASLILGMVALYYGYEKSFMTKRSTDDVRMWLQIVAIATIILSLIGALQSLLRLFRATFRI